MIYAHFNEPSILAFITVRRIFASEHHGIPATMWWLMYHQISCSNTLQQGLSQPKIFAHRQ